MHLNLSICKAPCKLGHLDLNPAVVLAGGGGGGFLSATIFKKKKKKTKKTPRKEGEYWNK